MSSKNTTALRSDAAISGSGHQPDRLRRTKFASHVAREFLLPLRDSSLVVSVEGPWGYGKTSTFNLMKKHLPKSEAIVFDFNPWMAGSAELLTEAFLIQLATAIGLHDRAKEGQDAAKQLVGYSNIFTALKFIPGAEPWASIVEGVVKSVGQATASASDLRKLNLEKRKTAAVSALMKLDKPIVAFIDDLDRLLPSEVFEMIRVVKAVADFPRITYVIAFDVAHVQGALGKAGISQPMEYLEKLIQVRLNLPAIAQSDIQKMLQDETNTLPSRLLEPFSKEDEGRLAWLYHSGLSALIETPRDVNRIFNRLALSGSVLAGEVAFPELFALETLAVKCPTVYERIHAEPDYFLKPREKERSAFDPKVEPDPLDLLLVNVQERYRPHVKNVVHELFPGTSESSAHDKWRSMRSKGRLAAPDRLYAALSLDTPAGELPIVEVRSFMLSKADRGQFSTRRLNDENVGRLFEHIDTFPDIEIDDPEDFVVRIAEICDSGIGRDHDERIEGQGTFGLLLSRRAWVTVKRRLDTVAQGPRLGILRKLIVETGSRDLAAAAAAECFAQHQPKGTEDEFGGKRQWVTKDKAEEMCEAWATRTLPLLADQKIDAMSVREIYRTARYVCPTKLAQVTASLISTDAGIDRLARIIGRTGFVSPGGPYVHIVDDQLRDLGDVPSIRKRVAARLKRLSPKADIPLRSALKSIATGKGFITTTGKESNTH